MNKGVKEREKKKNRKRETAPGFILFFPVESEKKGSWEAERGTWYVMCSSLRPDGGDELRSKGGRLKQLLWVEAVC